MNPNDFLKELKDASSNGSLMTPKHDPNNLGTTFSSYRTVLSNKLADNLSNFISSCKFTVEEYENTKIQNSPPYFAITPHQDSGFNIPASGVTANSVFASTTVDTLVVVSGRT